MNTTKPFALVLTGDAWETALRELLLERDRFAVGKLRINDEPASRELLCHRLEITSEVPRGAEHGTLADWVVLTVDHEDRPANAAERVNRLSPYRSQILAVLTLSSTNREQWNGCVYDQGRILPLEEVRIVGAGMLRFAQARDEDLEEGVLRRWSRTRGALGDAVWKRIHRSHVLQIGCGRSGTVMAWQLAALGVGRLTLVDGDRLHLENLDGMPGIDPDQIGRKKVTALAERLTRFRPDMGLRCVAEPVMDVVEQLRARVDLIVTCVDDDTPRLAASWLSRELLTVHLDVGTSIQSEEGGETTITGDVRLLLPYRGCVVCVGGLADTDASFYEFSAPAGSLHRGEPLEWTEQRAGSLITMNSIAVSVAVSAWLDLNGGTRSTTSVWHRLRWRGGSLEAEAAAVGSVEGCLFCDSQ